MRFIGIEKISINLIFAFNIMLIYDFFSRSGLDKHRVMIHGEKADCCCDECGKFYEGMYPRFGQ